MSAKPAARLGFLFLLGIFLFFLLGVACVSASPSMLSFVQSGSLPTPTQSVNFILADIPKPSPTPLSTVTPPALPTQTQLPIETQPTAETPPPLEMSIVDTSSLTSSSSYTAPSVSNGKYILVDISEQHMYVYENGELLWSFVASTGIQNSTRTGLFHVQSKIPNAYGATWNIWMPKWLGIYWSGSLENGIHALPILSNGSELWAGYLGHPVSYGCVVLSSYDAGLLYDWAEIGTPVEIRW